MNTKPHPTPESVKHTPLPWAVDGNDICQANNGHFHVIAQVKLFKDYDDLDIKNKKSAPDRHQYLVELSCPVEGNEEENANLIAGAVNSHHCLVAERDHLRQALEKIYSGSVMAGKVNWSHADVIQEHYKIARAALANHPSRTREASNG